MNILYTVDLIDENVEWNVSSAAIVCKEAEHFQKLKQQEESDERERRQTIQKTQMKQPPPSAIDNRKNEDKSHIVCFMISLLLFFIYFSAIFDAKINCKTTKTC